MMSKICCPSTGRNYCSPAIYGCLYGDGRRVTGIGPIYLKLQGRVLYRIADVEAYEKQSLRKSTSQPLAAHAGGAA